MILVSIFYGIVSGVFVALLGYAKSSTVESFDWRKALQTMIVGGVVGGIAGYNGWTYQQAYEWASTMGVITIVEYVKKAVWRRFRR